MSALKNVMLVLIKNLRTMYSVQVRYACCDNTGENVDFEQSCKQEGMDIQLNYIAQGTHNNMAMLNRNLLPLSIGYVPCSMLGNFLPSYKTAYGLKPPAQSSFWKTIFSLQIELPISTIVWEGKEMYSKFGAKMW